MLILDQGQSFVVMPVCYHPTTVLSVDDESAFLRYLEMELSDHLSLLCFDSANKAIEYVKNSREILLPFAARLHFTGKADTKACGFSTMQETVVQDLIHPFPKDLDMSFSQSNKSVSNSVSNNDKTKRHKTFDEFNHSHYILTETALYYYNQLDKTCDWISSDPIVLKWLNQNFPQEVEFLDYDKLDKITEITKHQRPSKLDISIFESRNESYNKRKFNEIILVTTDYDMPEKNGIEFIKTVAFPGLTLEHVLIILTGKHTDEFKDKLHELSRPTEYIYKNDPEWGRKLLKLIDAKTSRVFQDCSHKVLRILTQDTQEEACFVFDKAFGDLFTAHLKENKICELYLFDRQGSYLLLDDNAELSWFIIRSEKGMENSIQKAIAYGAPESVISGLQSRQMVLSLYEDYDFSRVKNKLMMEQLAAQAERKKEEDHTNAPTEIHIAIDWDNYLHPASVFESQTNRFDGIGGPSDGEAHDNKPRTYYYAFIKDFPEHNIDKTRILSYKTFLKETAQRTG